MLILERKNKINNLSFHLRKLEQLKPQVSRKKEKIRMGGWGPMN